MKSNFVDRLEWVQLMFTCHLCRSSDWQLRLVLYTPVFGGAGGFWVFMNSDPGYSIDAWHVKKAPNGLLYVSDFTAFTSSIVVTQVRHHRHFAFGCGLVRQISRCCVDG